MAGRDCEARTRFSAPPATARGEVSLRLRRAALRVRSHSGCAAWWARTARRVSSKPGAQHGRRAAAACNQSCARVAGPGARAGQPGEGSVSGRAGGRGPTTGAGRARACRPGSLAGRVAGDRPPAWGPRTHACQRGEGRLPRGARSTAGAQLGRSAARRSPCRHPSSDLRRIWA